MGPKYLIVKKGEHGAMLFYEDKVFIAPAMPLEEVFDPTGAGDTFAGGLIGYIARRDDTSFDTLKTAIIYGSAMASFTVEKFGTPWLAATIPFVVFGLFRYMDLVYRQEKGDRPEQILLTDGPLLADVALYGLAVLGILLRR